VNVSVPRVNLIYALNPLHLQCFDLFGRKTGCFDNLSCIHTKSLKVFRNFALFLCGTCSLAFVVSIAPTDFHFFFYRHNLYHLRVSVDFLDLFVDAFDEIVISVDFRYFFYGKEN